MRRALSRRDRVDATLPHRFEPLNSTSGGASAGPAMAQPPPPILVEPMQNSARRFECERSGHRDKAAVRASRTPDRIR